MDNGRELIDALVMVSQEKGIDKEIIFEAIEASLVSACKKHFGPTANVRVVVDRETGEYLVLAIKTIVEDVTDELIEISLADAHKINVQYELGDTVEVKIKPGNFGRISAQTAKQVVVQKFREAERENLYNEYVTKEGQLLTGVVQRADRRNVILDIGKLEALIPQQEQMPHEEYSFNTRMRVYVLEVKQTNKGPIVNVSRTHPNLLKHLLEQEVPEIADGTVEIKGAVREPGVRSKVAVYTRHPHVDPIGSCVGHNGQRITAISTELNNEKVDIVVWNEKPEAFIASALSPSKVTAVLIDQSAQIAYAIVPTSQLSLAIGKEGLNARLAARLTGWKIDILSEAQAEERKLSIEPEVKVDEGVEAAYANFYDETATTLKNDALLAGEQAREQGLGQESSQAHGIKLDAETPQSTEVFPGQTSTDEYYDDEYYDDEYYDDEYYDDEYYDDEYYDEAGVEPASEAE